MQYACSLTRAIYITVLTDLTVDNSIIFLKEFIARRGRPSKIYSDNAKTFIAASRKIRKIMKSDEVHNYLARSKLESRFNLSKAPWWRRTVRTNYRSHKAVYV